MDEKVKELERRNELCNEFSREWGEYFHENFPWDTMNLTDAYLTIVITVGNLFANYAKEDIEGGFIALDTFMDGMKDKMAKVMMSYVEDTNIGEGVNK